MGKDTKDDEGVGSPKRSSDEGEGEKESRLDNSVEESTAD